MKKILVVAPYFYPHGGGLENYAYQVARRLVQNGYTVHVLCMDKSEPLTQLFDGIVVHRKKADFVVSNTPIRLHLVADILHLLHAHCFDVIHAHTPVPFAVDVAALASRIKRVPLVITYHTSTLFKDQIFFDILTSCYLPFQFITMSRAKRIAAVTGNTDWTMKRWKSKTIVVPPGVDPDVFQYTPYPSNTKNILLIAPLSKAYPSKGVSVMLEAFTRIIKQHPNAILNIVGGGELNIYYRNLTKELGIEQSTMFHGKVDYNLIPKLYRSNNILVVPSIKSEGTPTVLLEAMACGRPVVGTKIGGIPEIVQDGLTGLIIPPNDSNESERSINYLLAHPDTADKYGRSGRRLVEQRYTWDTITEQYIRLYDSCI